MNLKVKRLTETARLPEKAFPTEAGYDELSESDRGENGFGSTGV